MITFLIVFFVLLYFLSDISYSVSTNNYLYVKEKYKLLFKKLDKEIETVEADDDGVSITIKTETKKSVSTSTLSFNDK